MEYKKKCESETRNYLKKLQKNALTAFSIGYADGEEGRMQVLPPLPSPSEGLLYAAQLLALELYKDGYKAGERVRKHGSV